MRNASGAGSRAEAAGATVPVPKVRLRGCKKHKLEYSNVLEGVPLVFGLEVAFAM